MPTMISTSRGHPSGDAMSPAQLLAAGRARHAQHQEHLCLVAVLMFLKIRPLEFLSSNATTRLDMLAGCLSSTPSIRSRPYWQKLSLNLLTASQLSPGGLPSLDNVEETCSLSQQAPMPTLALNNGLTSQNGSSEGSVSPQHPSSPFQSNAPLPLHLQSSQNQSLNPSARSFSYRLRRTSSSSPPGLCPETCPGLVLPHLSHHRPSILLPPASKKARHRRRAKALLGHTPLHLRQTRGTQSPLPQLRRLRRSTLGHQGSAT
jgi:hypothetical protein